jgi:F-type H+-transporting ATPase subunit epsilon
MSLNVHLTTPSKTIWDAPATEVILPTKTGLLGILKGHVPLMTMIDTGLVKIRFEKIWIPIYVSGGFASVEKDEITILVNEAERGNKIDVDAAKTALEMAEINLSEAEKPAEKLLAAQKFKKAKYRLAAAVEFPAVVAVNLPGEANNLSGNKRSLEMLEKLE